MQCWIVGKQVLLVYFRTGDRRIPSAAKSLGFGIAPLLYLGFRIEW